MRLIWLSLACAALTLSSPHAAALETDTVIVPPAPRVALKRARHGKQTLPVWIGPIEAVDPPRDRPATEWLSPYCTRWHANGITCERQDLDPRKPATCRRTAETGSAVVVCDQLRDIDHYCSVVVRIHGRRFYTDHFGTRHLKGRYEIVEREQDYGYKRTNEPLNAEDISTLLRRANGTIARHISPEERVICLNPYTKEKSRPIRSP